VILGRSSTLLLILSAGSMGWESIVLALRLSMPAVVITVGHVWQFRTVIGRTKLGDGESLRISLGCPVSPEWCHQRHAGECLFWVQVSAQVFCKRAQSVDANGPVIEDFCLSAGRESDRSRDGYGAHDSMTSPCSDGMGKRTRRGHPLSPSFQRGYLSADRRRSRRDVRGRERVRRDNSPQITSRPLAGAMPIRATVPEVNARKSASMPSLKITPPSGMRERRVSCSPFVTRP